MKDYLKEYLDILQDEVKEGSFKGFPVFAAAFDDKEKKLISIQYNKKSSSKKTDFRNHAEYSLKDLNEITDKSITLFITLPPCFFCLRELVNKGLNITNIFYLTDPRKKHKKEYIINSGIKINSSHYFYNHEFVIENKKRIKAAIHSLTHQSHRSSKQDIKG